MQSHTTTPFGRRTLSLAMVASQAATKEFTARPSASETVVHKWRLFRALTEAKAPLGVTDRALSVLHALLSFHQETALMLDRDPNPSETEAGPGIIVFPSNKELSIRAHGMAPATLRRHLAVLVEAGLIIRRDSPNGKRFALRGQGGEIADAFGFDLTPLVARATEIENLAEECGEPRDHATARKNHSAAAGHHEDDRDGPGRGRSRRLGGASRRLPGARQPPVAQDAAGRSGDLGSGTPRSRSGDQQCAGKSRETPEYGRQ